MALISNYGFFSFVVVILSIVGFLLTAPIDDEKDYLDEDWFAPTSAPLPATTAAPERAVVTCEKASKKFNNVTSDAMKEDIKVLMNEYNDWGKLLAPAPVAIGILGQLILMANQLKDFPINHNDPNEPPKVFQHIKYPESFRTTLLQISQKGYLAFLTAHRNMDAIRVHNSVVPSDIKDAVRYLTSGNAKIIDLRLRPTWMRIDEAAKKSQALSKEVVDEFQLVMALIDETGLAVSSTKSVHENRLDDVNFDLKLSNHSKVFSENETTILREKDTKMKEILSRLENRKDNVLITTTYHGGSFTMNLVKDWVQEMGEARYKKDGKFLKDTSQIWRYSYNKEFVDSNPCAQENSEHLLDLLLAFGQYRQRYEKWQNSDRTNTSSFDGSSTINNFEVIVKNLKPCNNSIKSIIEKGNDLVKKLNSDFQSKDKKTPLPGETAIYDITSSINTLRTAANEVTEKSDRQVEIVTNSAWEIYGVSKRHQLDQLNSMSKTVEDIVKLNNDMMEIRRKKTREILDRIVSLNITKVSTENVIQVLRDGLEELGKLKNHWGKLIEFFGKIRTFIESASRHSAALVEIVQAMSRNPSEVMDNKFMLTELRINFEKSNEAVLLVHGIADMYVNVSNLYIKDRLVRLNTMNSMRINGTTDEELKREKGKLISDAEMASQGIIDYIRRHETELNQELQTRHKGILREYRKILFCVRKHGLEDIAVNFTGDYWFQIKSRNNSKVMEVSTENQVQLWESNNGDHQLWYLDQQQIIRSVISDFCLTSNDSTKHVIMKPCQDNAINQKWTLRDNMIVNTVKSDRCLVLRYKEDMNGSHIYDVEIGQTDKKLWEMV